MSHRKPTEIAPYRASAIEIAVDLSLRDMAVWSGIGTNKLRAHTLDAVDPLPFYNVGRKILINKEQYLEWRHRRFASTNPDPAIVAPRPRRRKHRARQQAV